MDYTTLAYESMMEALPLEQEAYESCLVAESEFIISCLESGYMMPLMEADSKEKNAPGRIRQLLDAVKEFFAKIIAIFRKKAVDYSRRYSQWAKDNKDLFIKKARDIKELSYSPYNANGRPDANGIMNIIKHAYDPKDLNDATWAGVTIKGVKTLDELKAVNHISDRLKNYCRFGINTDDSVKQITQSGTELVAVLPIMINYVANYEKISKKMDTIQNTFDSASTAFMSKYKTLRFELDNTKDASGADKKEAAQDSYYLEVEGCPVCESDLVGLLDYDAIMEASGRKIKPNTKPNGGSMSDVAKQDTSKSDPEANKQRIENEKKNDSDGSKDDKSGVKDEQGNNVNVKDVDVEKKEGTSDDKRDGKSEGESPAAPAIKYVNEINSYCKLLVTAYQTAMEEAFLVYIKILIQVMGHGPKFDKKGKYVPETDRTDADKTEVTKPEDETEDEESFIPSSDDTPVMEHSNIKISLDLFR